MLKDITLGQYFPGTSYIHRLDPRVKILLTIAYITSIFLVQNFMAYGIIFLFTVFLMIISQVPVSYMLKGLKPLFVFIVLTAMLNIFLTGGQPVFPPFYGITITYEGIYFAIFMIFRIVFLIIGSSLLTLTTSPIALTDGIERLLNPFKKIGIPAHELAMMMTIALRFIPTLLEETEKIIKAQASRGADFETGGILKRAKALIPILVPLFISAFRRADELAIAMECRCYRGGENRTRLKQLKASRLDLIASLATIVIIASVVAINFFNIL